LLEGGHRGYGERSVDAVDLAWIDAFAAERRLYALHDRPGLARFLQGEKEGTEEVPALL